MDEKPKANQQTFASVTDGDFDDIIVQENSEENNEDRFPSDVNSGSDDDGNQKKKKKAPNGIDVEEAKETPPDNLQETTPPHGAFAVPGNDSMEERDDSDTDNKIFDITRRRVINQILAGDDKQLLGDGCEDSYGGSRCPRAVIDDIAMPQNPLPNDVEELQENHHTDDNNDDTDGGDPLREAGAPRPPTRRTRRLRITGRPGAIAVRGPGRPRTNNPAEAPVQTNRARAEPVVANPVPSHIVEAEERRAWWDVRQRRQQEQQFHHQAIAIATPVDDDAQQQREDKPFWGNPCFWFVLFGFVAVVGAVGTSLLLRDNPAAAKTEVETPVSPPQPSNETQVGFCNSNSDCKMNQRCANDTCLAKLGTCEVCIRNDECSSTLCLFGKCYPEDGNAPDGCGCTFDGDCNSTRCDDNICKAQLGVCESCNVPSDCLSGRCRFGETCYPNEGPAPNGCICYEDDHCDSGWCGWDLTCQPRLTDGSICFGHNACESGRCAANGTCQAQLEVCEDCVADADCNSGSCKSNSCYPSVGGAPDGCGCTLNDDCEGRCNANGLCQPRYLDGSECTINSDCVSSWCPLDNICQPIPSNLQEFLEQVLGSMAFSDPSSSHVQALDWLEEEDALQNGQGSAATIIQRFVLVLLYLSTNGHSWLPPNQFNFLSAGNSICNWNNGWEGIFCENGLVVQIDLGKPVCKLFIYCFVLSIRLLTQPCCWYAAVGLDGTIPTEIGLISTLGTCDNSVHLAQEDQFFPASKHCVLFPFCLLCESLFEQSGCFSSIMPLPVRSHPNWDR